MVKTALPLILSALTFCAATSPAIAELADATIETIAGAGGATNNGDEGSAKGTNIGQTFGVEIGPDGALYICEVQNHRVRRLDLDSLRVTTVAGNATKGYSGDGGPATAAAMNEPYEVRFDADGNMYVVEMQNHIVRRVAAHDGTITTIAGNGTRGFAGDGGQATSAQLNRPHSIALDGQRNLYIADIGNHRIRRVDLVAGTIKTIAGNGQRDLPVDGQIALGNSLVGPRALFVRNDTLWIALREGHSVWKMSLRDGRLIHLAGSGQKGYSGDRGPAKEATFNGPKGIVVDTSERVYVVDTENQVIRLIDTHADRVTTLAGSGRRGFGGDGGPASAASLDRPHGICWSSDGSIYIGDTNNHRIRVVRPEAQGR